jgi:L-aspartate semialdehyde sulfurtransferase
MDPEFVRGAVFEKYGVSLYNGIGIPIPVIDEDIAEKLAVTNDRLFTEIQDYGQGRRSKPVLAKVSYAQLRSGSVMINGRNVPTAPLSSLAKAIKIMNILKQQILSGTFLLGEPAFMLPRHKENLKTLNER